MEPGAVAVSDGMLEEEGPPAVVGDHPVDIPVPYRPLANPQEPPTHDSGFPRQDSGCRSIKVKAMLAVAFLKFSLKTTTCFCKLLTAFLNDPSLVENAGVVVEDVSMLNGCKCQTL
jgi:hypothetical protein